jgi:hypothetical protein
VLPDEERGGSLPSHPDADSTTASIATWADTYAEAQRWVRWNARRRWPAFPCNNDVWAASVTDWETSGRRVA